MLTGRAAELRPDINYLHVHPRRLDVPQTPKTAAPGEFATMLREYGRIKNIERATERHARNRGRDIPTSGPGRRRAKAKRNRDAVYADITATVTKPQIIARGRRHEGAGLLTEILDWCHAHPHEGPLPESGALTMRREHDTVVVEGEPPTILAISGDLLDMAEPRFLSFADGVLTMAVRPEPLHYRPLGPHPSSRVVVFERTLRED